MSSRHYTSSGQSHAYTPHSTLWKVTAGKPPLTRSVGFTNHALADTFIKAYLKAGGLNIQLIPPKGNYALIPPQVD